MTFEEKREIEKKVGLSSTANYKNISKEDYEYMLKGLKNAFAILFNEGDDYLEDDI